LTPTNENRFSWSTSPSLAFGGFRLTPLQALALVTLADVRRFEFAPGGIDGGRCLTTWRRWLASNLSLLEYQRKAWRRSKLVDYWRQTLKELRGLKALPVSGLVVTDTGAAVAAGLRPMFQPPMPVPQLVDFNRQTYARLSGRFAT